MAQVWFLGFSLDDIAGTNIERVLRFVEALSDRIGVRYPLEIGMPPWPNIPAPISGSDCAVGGGFDSEAQ